MAFGSMGVAGMGSSGRPILRADRTYYVLKTGSNSNNGLANTAGGAFLTIMRALDVIATIDLNGFVVTVQIGDGTYSEHVLVPRLVGQKDTNSLIIKGNVTTPANVVVSNATSFQPAVEVINGAMATLSSFRVTATNNGYGVNAAEGAVVNISGGMDFGACGQYHMYANEGGVINCFNPYTFSGAAIAHWASSFSGNIFSNTTVDGGGAAIAFTEFAQVFSGGNMQLFGSTFTNVGSVTGKRYDAQSNGTIQTFGAGASFLPGNAVGTTATGGLYQ